MAVNGVGSSASAMQQQIASERQSQFQPSQPSEKPQPRASAAATRDTQQAQSQSRPERNERSSESQRPERDAPPKPVVNAQGQKTGTIINTTA